MGLIDAVKGLRSRIEATKQHMKEEGENIKKALEST